MSNIWEFLLQTLSVSMVAAVLLILKWLFLDKLSPRWQYGVWSVLALRVILPISLLRYVVVPLHLWLETEKGLVEETLNSAYTQVYELMDIKHVMPVIGGAPQSVTDWLFVIYVAGAAVSLLWYIVSYCRLRLLLRKGTPVAAALAQKINDVCEKYNLKACRTVAVEGLPSAFVCGGVRPVLAVPQAEELDEKIILHELLHLEHYDALQNLFWCALRSLHWCNPFLQIVFHIIGNDMESLCDQRVLERLEGEERRAYGVILLDMASERYARAPGTTSISNGAKNIARRIAAVVRFKKYPRGMRLVSLCIVILLSLPLLYGTELTFAEQKFTPVEHQLEQAMAMTRMNRCTTVAGAIDTYAKALLNNNGIYMATASPLSKHADLLAQMRGNIDGGESTNVYELDFWTEDEIAYVYCNNGYHLYDVIGQEDGSFTATIAIRVDQNEDANTAAEENYYKYTGCTVYIPLTIRYEDGWVVEEGERMYSLDKFDEIYSFIEASEDLPWTEMSATGKTGTVTLRSRSFYFIDNNTQTSLPFFTEFDDSPKTDAEFTRRDTYVIAEYEWKENAEGKSPLISAGVHLTPIISEDEKVEFPDIAAKENLIQNITIGTTMDDGHDFEYGGALIASGSTSVRQTLCFMDHENNIMATPTMYRVQLFWGENIVEELTIKGE